MIKRLGRNVLSSVLEWQVRRLRNRHEFRVVAVAGSVGKTSVKSAIATVLSQQARVRFQNGNYNDRLTVPLIFFGHVEPAIFNVPAWLRIVAANERQIRADYPYDIVVVELGTDGPGQLAEFAYIRPEIGVVTAVANEHMEYFGTLDAVAEEELTLANFAKQAIVNADDVDTKYLLEYQGLTYGTGENDTYRLVSRSAHNEAGQELVLQLKGTYHTIPTTLLGLQGAKTVLAAAAVACELGLSGESLAAALTQVQAFPGRMQLLAGQQNSQLIDDTYNSSPLAAKAALDVVYASAAPQKIVIFGSMNELGAESAALHQEVGAYCRPDGFDLMITIGAEAEKYVAPVAIAAGCTVESYASPYDAGRAALHALQPHALVLAKGSQNGVFAEEALKLLLASPTDAQKLVRQSPYWMAAKRQQFPKQ